MSAELFSSFYATVPYLVKDDNGYDKELFSFVSTLRFYGDGTVECFESKTIAVSKDVDLRPICHLKGEFMVQDDGSIDFNLMRSKDAETAEVHETSEDVQLRAIRRGQYKAIFHKRFMYIVCSTVKKIPTSYRSNRDLQPFIPVQEHIDQFKCRRQMGVLSYPIQRSTNYRK